MLLFVVASAGSDNLTRAAIYIMSFPEVQRWEPDREIGDRLDTILYKTTTDVV